MNDLLGVGIFLGIVFLMFWGLVTFLKVKNAIPGWRFRKEFGILPNAEYALVEKAIKIRLQELRGYVLYWNQEHDRDREKVANAGTREEIQALQKGMVLVIKAKRRAEARYGIARKRTTVAYAIGEAGVKSIENSLTSASDALRKI